MFTISYLAQVVKKDIPSLPTRMKVVIRKAIETRLALDPVGFGKPLQYSLKNHRRLRVGDYRVVYRIEEQTVLIIAIKHRKEVYSKF